MKQIVQHETHGEIVYDESFWSGKKSVSVGGTALEKIAKKEFKADDGSTVTVAGSYLIGVTVNYKGEAIRVIPKLKWYEILLCILPFILTVTWGNIPALCAIIPLVGGAIGGGIGGLMSVLGLLAIRSVKPLWLKLVVALGFFAVTFGICVGIGYAIVAANV